MSTQAVLVVGPVDGANGLEARLGDGVSCTALASPPPAGEPVPGRPQAAVVATGHDPDAAFAFVSRLAAEGVKAVVVGPSKDADLILRAMRAGAVEFTVAGEEAHLLHAVRGLLHPAGGRQRGSVIAVFSPKGGVGTTTLAVNLAGAIAKRGERACLLDLDLGTGDALSFLDLAASYGVSDVIANLHRLDGELLEASLPRHRSGLRVLAQGHGIEDADGIRASSIGPLVEFLRGHYEVVLVDGLRGFGELSLAALDASTSILLVVTQEIPALRNARRCMELFRRLGYGEDRIRLVVNRYHARSRIPDDLLAETAGLPIAARVANDYPLVDRCIRGGSLVVEEGGRSQLARDLGSLVETLVRASAPATPRSLLRRVFAGR